MRCARKGVTFLEVVVAMAMLITVVSMLTGTLGFIENSAAAHRRHAEALEVAHRIIIQHMEDPALLRGQPRRVELNGTLYGFEITEAVLKPSANSEEGITVQNAVDVSEIDAGVRFTHKLHLVSVEVFIDDPDIQRDGHTLTTLRRIYNPLSLENPNDLIKIVQDWRGLDLEKQREEAESGGGDGSSGSSSGGTGSGAGTGGGR